MVAVENTSHVIRRAVLIAVAVFVGSITASFGGMSVVYAMVLFGDDAHLKKSTIMARINEETTIVCEDEQTHIGSFFNTEHRRYVPIEEVPPAMINAIVAAEDKNFFKHSGVDPVAIVKAFAEGLQGRRFRGGSTLTQQTVKNIMDRWEYSLGRKIREAIAALQLERMYSKKQILEFYLNQFHVSGNGTGIGIAAKYYFNKEVKDLDLVESAFIAGSVKGPGKYDPFIKYTVERREDAIRNAFERKNYVLRRMLEQGWINDQEFKEAFDKVVPFNRGSFRTSEVATVSLIRSQLDRKEILDALNMESVDELNSAGLKIFTTIDCPVQEGAQQAMRRNLSRLETILGGYAPEPAEKFIRQRDLAVNEFYYGKVEQVVKNPTNASIRVSFGLANGTIPHDALVRYAKLLDLPLLQGPQVQLKKLLDSVRPGDILFTEVKEYEKEKHEAVLEMHKRPKINGGLLGVEKGEVRSVVSGFDSLGFNRAVFAKRQPGSVFKSVVFYAALQLGWSVLDRLDNERQIFPYQSRLYFPRPDHPSPYKEVSMIWAGTMSENLASVYLAAHLVDKLNYEQFKQLMGELDLLPHNGESVPDFHFRVARTTGVQLDNEGVREFQLQNAIADVAPDLVFGGQPDMLRKLNKMWWGRGYISELQNLFGRMKDTMPAYEKALRLGLVRNNYLRFAGIATELNSDWTNVSKKVAEKGIEGAFADPAIQHIWKHFKVLAGVGARPQLGYFVSLEGEDPRRDFKARADLERIAGVPGRALNLLDAQAIWSSGVFVTADIQLGDVLLDGYLPLNTFNKLQKSINERFDAVMVQQSEYDLHRYYQHHDLRMTLGLRYLVQLSQAMGVQSKLEPVLSFPLGTNDVTAGEVAKVYQTFVSGKIYRFYKEGPANQLNFIRRIEDRFGAKLFEPKAIEHQLVSPQLSVPMREILKRVVTHGTGRRARGEIFVQVGAGPNPADAAANPDAKAARIRMPAFGKTGTTNDYNNAYFAGFFPMPKAKGEAMQFDNNMTIASYVGYDLNKTMRRGGVKVTGSVGALPVWIDYVKLIIDKHKFADLVDPTDINIVANGEWPMQYERGVGSLNIDLPRGTVLRGGESGQAEVFATTDIEKTGENPENEFAIGNQVTTVIRVPTERDGALRLFSLFKSPDGSRFETGPASAPVSIDDKRLPGGNLPLSVLGEMPAGAPVPDSAGLPGPVPSDRLGVGKGAGAYDPSAYDPSNDIMPHEADIDEITPAGKGTDKKPEKAADKPSEGVPTTPKRDAKLNNPPEKPVRGIGGGKPDGDNGAGKPDGDKGADGDLW
jgi:penicillin-binding protein 1A